MKHIERSSKKVFFLLIAAILLIFSTDLPNCMATQQPIAADKAIFAGSILQFKSGSHIIGFASERVVLVTNDHLLSVGFVEANKIKPIALSSTEKSENRKGPALLGAVEYKELWPGITLRYDSVTDGLAESTYIVRPGADISKIRLKYNAPVILQKDGTLRIALSTKSGQMTESAPIAWQELGGQKVPVKVSFLISGGEVGFVVGDYDKSLPLIIDPSYQWHTFYGTDTSVDTPYALAVDSSGNVYVTGWSWDTWNGGPDACTTGTPPCPLNAYRGADDAVIMKLDSSGAYKWHAFYGGTSYDTSRAVAVDSSGNVYVTGVSEGAWNGPAGQAPKNAFTLKSGSGIYDNIYILKLDSSGAYQWHTFFGARNGNDQPWGVTADSSGNIYVTGGSSATWNGPDGEIPKHLHGDDTAIVVLKLDSAGAYQWHTFFGSGTWDSGHGITADSSGNIYVTGWSNDAWDGQAGQAPLNPFSSANESFILKLNSSGAYQWHTFYGSATYGQSITFDGSANIFVTGHTYSSWDGPGSCLTTGIPPCPLNDYSGGADAFILKLNGSGAYKWHTFFGSNNRDLGNGIALDGGGNIYVTGTSSATWNGGPDACTTGTPPCPLNAYTGASDDIFVLKLSSDGIYRWHTFYQSYYVDDKGQSIALDRNGYIYTTGVTKTSWNGPSGELPLHDYGGGGKNNIFVLKLAPTACPENAVTIEGTSYYNTSVQTAYQAASPGQSVLIQAMDFTEDLSLNNDGSFRLRGGYECDFTSNPGRTAIRGKVTVLKGTVNIENLVIK